MSAILELARSQKITEEENDLEVAKTQTHFKTRQEIVHHVSETWILQDNEKVNLEMRNESIPTNKWRSYKTTVKVIHIFWDMRVSKNTK